MASVVRRRVRERAGPKPIAESPRRRGALFSANATGRAGRAWTVKLFHHGAGDYRRTGMSLRRCCSGPLEGKTLERGEAGVGRYGALAAAPFTRTPEGLRRQLVVSHPDVPSGFALGGFPGPGTARSDDFRLGVKRFERPALGVAVSVADAVRVGHYLG